MKKLYIVRGTKEEFKVLASTLRTDWIGIHTYHYEERNVNKVGKLLNNNSIFPDYMYKGNKIVDQIITLVDKNTTVLYDDLLDWLSRWNGHRERVFVLVNDNRIANKLKRDTKRPNYVTVLLTPTVNVDKGKYDFVLTTGNDTLFKKQIRSFGKQRLASFNIINSKRIRI